MESTLLVLCTMLLILGGVQPVYIPAVWKLVVPPKIHMFLCLLANNRLMTRDNLLKRHIDRGKDCLFCSCNESIANLFFGCVVSFNMWPFVQGFFKIPVGANFESVARL